ncbi:hypothetical protein V6N13_109347 [Hibiscus sabdariffa]
MVWYHSSIKLSLHFMRLLMRSLHCFELSWPWRKTSFFQKPTPRSKVPEAIAPIFNARVGSIDRNFR